MKHRFCVWICFLQHRLSYFKTVKQEKNIFKKWQKKENDQVENSNIHFNGQDRQDRIIGGQKWGKKGQIHKLQEGRIEGIKKVGFNDCNTILEEKIEQIIVNKVKQGKKDLVSLNLTVGDAGIERCQ